MIGVIFIILNKDICSKKNRKKFQIPISIDQIKLSFQNKITRNTSLTLKKENDDDNVKIDMENRILTNSPTLRKRRPSTPRLKTNRIHPINPPSPVSSPKRKELIKSNSYSDKLHTVPSPRRRLKRGSTVSEKISEDKIKNNDKQLKIYSEYLLNQINTENHIDELKNKTSPTSKELIDKSNKLLEDIEKDLYDYKPEVDRKNKPRDIIKKVIKKEKRRSTKQKLLPVDYINNMKPKMLIREIPAPKILPKPKPKILPKPKIKIKEITKKEPVNFSYTLNFDEDEAKYKIDYKSKQEYELDVNTLNEHMHCSHYLDKKGIINETLTFDQPKQIKSKSATLKSKRKVPRPPLGPPPDLNDNVSKYRLEAENILRNKRGNVMKKIKAIEKLKK